MSLYLLYNELMAAAPDGALDTGLQRRILEHARRNDARDLAVALLGRNDLDPEIDREIGRSSELDVLIPWILRSGRDPGELVERLNRETRVKILSTLAGTAGLPETAYTALAEHTSEKILWTLLENPDAPLSAVRQALKAIVTGSPRSNNRYDVASQLAAVLNGSRYRRTLWDDVAMNAMITPYALAALEHGSCAPEQIDRLITDIGELHCFDQSRWRDHTGRLVSAMAGHGMTRDQHRLLCETVADLIEMAQHPRTTWVQELNHAAGTLRAYDIRAEERIHRLREERNPVAFSETLRELLRFCLGAQRHRLLVTALENPVAPLADLYSLRASLNMAGTGTLVRRIREAGRRDLLVAWLDEHRDREHPPALLSFVPDPRELTDEYLEGLAAENRLWPAWALQTQRVREDPELALAHLPWGVLCGNTSMIEGLAELVTTRLAASLHDDARWEAFETIGASFEGSFHDLVSVVAALSD